MHVKVKIYTGEEAGSNFACVSLWRSGECKVRNPKKAAAVCPLYFFSMLVDRGTPFAIIHAGRNYPHR